MIYKKSVFDIEFWNKEAFAFVVRCRSGCHPFDCFRFYPPVENCIIVTDFEICVN